LINKQTKLKLVQVANQREIKRIYYIYTRHTGDLKKLKVFDTAKFKRPGWKQSHRRVELWQ
jgi:hypothetical protein